MGIDKHAIRLLARSHRSPPNSDYFPYVDQRAAGDRFRNATARAIFALRESSIPMLDFEAGVRNCSQWRRPWSPWGSLRQISCVRSRNVATTFEASPVLPQSCSLASSCSSRMRVRW